MPVVNIKDGESLTQTVKTALRLERDRSAASNHARLVERVLELGKRASSRPVLDARNPDDIIGYDETGVPR